MDGSSSPSIRSLRLRVCSPHLCMGDDDYRILQSINQSINRFDHFHFYLWHRHETWITTMGLVTSLGHFILIDIYIYISNGNSVHWKRSQLTTMGWVNCSDGISSVSNHEATLATIVDQNTNFRSMRLWLG